MTNSNQYFKFNDKVLVDGELCTILRSKHSSLPSGHQSYKYQLNGADGKLVVIDGESWLMQAELKVKQSGLWPYIPRDDARFETLSRRV